MRTLHSYLLRQVLGSLLITVTIFTFVLMIGSALKEILPLLVNGQVGFGVVAEAIGLLIPFVWVLALPMGMLTATLLIFGRFSADQELTAVRASGISLLSLASPVLLLGLALCGISALINMDLGPRCRVAYNTMRANLKLGWSTAYLPEGRFIREFKGYLFYVDKNRNGDLEKVLVYRLSHETNAIDVVRAERGKLTVNAAEQKILLRLFDVDVVSMTGAPSAHLAESEIELDLRPPSRTRVDAKISDMSFTQLRQELRRLEREASPAVDVSNLPREKRRDAIETIKKQRKDLLSRVIFHMHRQVAFSFACFGFTLVGIPLAIRVHRRETNIGIAIALVLVVLYYSFIILGQSLSSRPQYLPYLIVWIPNFLFQSVGAVLLWRANRGI